MPRHRPRPVRDACEAAALLGVLALLRSLPFGFALEAGGCLGALVGRLDRRHLALAEAQMSEALGAGFDGRTGARAVYRHLGMCLAELAWLPRRARRPADMTAWVRIEGMEHVQAALARGRGLAIVSGHLGNWELAAAAMASAGIPLSLVARPLDNLRLDAVLTSIRMAGGSEVISKRNALRAVREVLARGRGLAILIDQDAREHGVFVPFFGRPASTIPSIAAVCLRAEAPLVVTAMRRDPGGRTHTLTFEAVTPPPPSGDAKEDVRALTGLLTARLEARIRKAPEQWLWMHRRWKTRAPTGS